MCISHNGTMLKLYRHNKVCVFSIFLKKTLDKPLAM